MDNSLSISTTLPEIKVTRDSPTPPEHENSPNKSNTADAVETAFPAAFSSAAVTASESRLDKFEDKLSPSIGHVHDAYRMLNDYYAENSEAINSAGHALAANSDTKAIEGALSRFIEVSKVLVDGLDLLGRLHPFLGVAILPFKLMITMDLTRRENNKKVLAVKIQIQDTMSVLFRLRHTHDVKVKAPDGNWIEGLSDLIKNIAADIKICGAACDQYLNKGSLAKMIKSKIYEGRLEDFMGKFDQHRQKLMLFLQAHIAVSVDDAIEKLDGQTGELRLIKHMVEALFRKLDTPREREVQKFIIAKGGAKACLDNDSYLKELIEKSGEKLSSFDPKQSGKGDLATARKMLDAELKEDFDKALAKHTDIFLRKLDAHEKQLTDVIDETGEHVISVVIGYLSGGIHAKVKDPDLKQLWEEQGWKGSVNARGFVLALNDYYTEKFDRSGLSAANSVVGSPTNSAAGSPPATPIILAAPLAFPVLTSTTIEASEDERWALAYINVAHLQPLLDVIDTDGTGLISIKEANHFARLRPRTWSLIKWLAFWAAGWHLTVTWFKNMIYKILSTMLSLMRRAKVANANAMYGYLSGPGIRRVELLLRSTRSAEAVSPSAYPTDAHLAQVATEFRVTEADKLKRQLARLRYELDNITTLRLTTGLRRIERIELYIFPLLYQILLRHLDIMRLACLHNLHESEFDTMSTSLDSIFSAVEQRAARLAVIYKSNALDGKEGLGLFAFGMFQLFLGQHEPDPINYTLRTFQEEDGFVLEDSDELGPRDEDDENTAKAILEKVEPNILLNGILAEPEHETVLETKYLPQVTGAKSHIGMWTGHLTLSDGSTPEGKLSLVLIQRGDKLLGAAESYLAILNVSGTIEKQKSVIFTITWPDGYAVLCEGEYDAETDMITGLWSVKGYSETFSTVAGSVDSESAFVETSPPIAITEQDSSSPAITDGPPARSVNSDGGCEDKSVSGQAPFEFRRSLLEENGRLTTNALSARERFIELRKRQMVEWRGLATSRQPLTAEEETEFLQLKTEVLPSYSRLYNAVAELEIRQLIAHARICDSCSHEIYETRFFCIECINDLYSQCIDLCIECKEQTPRGLYDDFTHLRSHLLVKTTRHVYEDELKRIVSVARSIAEQIKAPSKAPAVTAASSSHSEDVLQSNRTTGKFQSQERACYHCEKPATYPFWVCIDCTEETYICAECETKGESVKQDGVETEHKHYHLLVLLFDNTPLLDVQVKDVTLQELKSKISALESKFAALEVKLEGRFASLEALLQKKLEVVPETPGPVIGN
ncbi:kinase domain-containing protein [Favolaschia claudopus]|uniref:Kinase domain-containing protein n=1 Tax=Favolaschia claudopus TaxID=2862362 RepID=A0AAW0BSR9_9AGAR